MLMKENERYLDGTIFNDACTFEYDDVIGLLERKYQEAEKQLKLGEVIKIKIGMAQKGMYHSIDFYAEKIK